MQNRPKIIPKSSKNRWKIHPKSINVARVGPPGGLLEASWEPLGVLGASGGPPGGVLGASWGVLGVSWWPTWLQLGSQNGAQIDQKSKQKSINFWMPLGIGFLKNVGGFWKEKWRQVGMRMASKIDANFERPYFQKTWFFFRKNNDFEGSGDRSWEEKSIKNQSQIDQKLKPKMDGLLASSFGGFWWVWGGKLAPKIA